jgi:chromate reductase
MANVINISNDQKIKKVAILVGNISKNSLSRNIAKYLMAVAPKSMLLEIIEIGQLSLYNEDFDKTPPAAWIDFREKISSYDGFLFVTSELNSSLPGALKNAIDIASRPIGHNLFDGKPGAIVSVATDEADSFGAHPHLMQSLHFLNVQTMQEPEAQIGDTKDLFDSNGNLTRASTLEYIQKFMNSFGDWIQK